MSSKNKRCLYYNISSCFHSSERVDFAVEERLTRFIFDAAMVLCRSRLWHLTLNKNCHFMTDIVRWRERPISVFNKASRRVHDCGDDDRGHSYKVSRGSGAKYCCCPTLSVYICFAECITRCF